MGKRVLNTANCTFTCPMLQGTILCRQKSHKVNDGTGTALTKSAELTGCGICSTLTSAAGGTPTQCTLKNSTNWIIGFDLRKKVNGVPILTEDAKMQCSVGGMISVQQLIPPIIPTVPTPSSVNVGIMDNSVIDHSAPANIEKNEPVQNSNAEKNISSPPESVDERYEDSRLERQEENAEPNLDSSEKECICKQNCKKKDNCRYWNAPSTIIKPPNKSSYLYSRILRENSPRKETYYENYVAPIMEEQGVTWGNQAHHLISADAAYSKYPELVKLGNYFGYDINGQDNCCFLPDSERQDEGKKYGEQDKHGKKSWAYEVMKLSGLQWHVGQHQYSITLPETVKQQYAEELAGLKCYNELLNDEIKKILGECDRRFRNKCLEKNYEEHRKWFLDKMNSLSGEIESHLNKFKNNPKRSTPYFVSQEALKYAYDIPSQGLVIMIYKTPTRWYLKKYKFANYLKYKQIKLSLKGTCEIYNPDSIRNDTLKKLIMFCDNVKCFIVLSDKDDFKLPFKDDQAKCYYICADEKGKIGSHFSAALAEMAENEKYDDESCKAVIKRRLEENGLL